MGSYSVVHDQPLTFNDIFIEVQNNLYEAKLRWYTSTDIFNSMQDQYNKIVAVMRPIEKTTFIPEVPEPYMNIGAQIPDYMYLAGLFNPNTNLWLEGLTYKQMKATYQTYLAIGEPRWVNIVDFTRILVWPYVPGVQGEVLFICYKASAPKITVAAIPMLPYSTGAKLIEYLTTMDLFEQAREFKKAKIWLDRALKPGKGDTKSVWQQCASEVQDLARMDRERVLEPYRWIFHGGQFLQNMWITAEEPGGTINGSNTIFTLANVPNPGNSLLLMISKGGVANGLIMFQGTDYNLNGQTITMTTYVPQIGDVMQAWYQID